MGLRRTARALASRLTPGGRAEGVARFAVRVGRLGRSVAPEFREEVDTVGLRLRGRWSYRQWALRHRLDDAAVHELDRWAATAPTDASITLLVIGDGDPVGSASLGWPRTRVHRVASLADAAAWIATPPSDTSSETAAAAVDSAAVGAAADEWVLVLDGGDNLFDGALGLLAQKIVADPALDAVSFDDELAEPGDGPPARFRPAWSPDTSLSFDLWERSVLFRRTAAAAAGGLDPNLGDQAWWDLWLRLGAGRHRRDGRSGSDIWAHAAEMCVRRIRRHPTVGDRGLVVVAAELRRRGWDATPQIDHRDDVQVVDLHWRLSDAPKVAIVVPTRHNAEFLDGLVADLADTTYENLTLVVVDNGERTEAAEADHVRWAEQMDGRYEVLWWTDEFNYSAVNNAGVRCASAAAASVLVFVNDDCRCPVRRSIEPLVGWATADGVVVAGAQLLAADGSIQHGGVMMGLNGLAEHLFAGTAPGRDTLLGPTDATRNVSAVTGAVLAIERELFESVGGFDESFRLVGGDVSLCLDAVSTSGRLAPRQPAGRVVVTATAPIVHLESATRGDYVVDDDAYRCWWRFQCTVRGGDPYVNPSLSRVRHDPTPASPLDPDPLDLLAGHFGRELRAGAQTVSTDRAAELAAACDVPTDTAARVEARHAREPGAIALRDATWFLPDFDSPFYGGVNTALRIASVLRRHRDVRSRFVMIGAPHDAFFRTAIEAAYPELGPVDLRFVDGALDPRLLDLPATDLAVATIWHSAYVVATFEAARRSAYLVQDFEPSFVPAGTEFALAEESYRLGLIGLCNTDTMGAMCTDQYGGRSVSFTPQVDGTIFHADGRRDAGGGDPVTVFLYARPGHWRNCWEIAAPALHRVKARFGDDVRIVTAGSWRRPAELDPSIEHLGLVDYRDTGALYRSADVGLALTVSRHPSYLPLELMACGVPTVAFDLGDDAAWLLRHDENCLLVPRTVAGVAEALGSLIADHRLRGRLQARGLDDIAARHSDWDGAILGAVDRLAGALDDLDCPERPGAARSWREL